MLSRTSCRVSTKCRTADSGCRLGLWGLQVRVQIPASSLPPHQTEPNQTYKQIPSLCYWILYLHFLLCQAEIKRVKRTKIPGLWRIQCQLLLVDMELSPALFLMTSHIPIFPRTLGSCLDWRVGFIHQNIQVDNRNNQEGAKLEFSSAQIGALVWLAFWCSHKGKGRREGHCRNHACLLWFPGSSFISSYYSENCRGGVWERGKCEMTSDTTVLSPAVAILFLGRSHLLS